MTFIFSVVKVFVVEEEAGFITLIGFPASLIPAFYQDAPIVETAPVPLPTVAELY